MKRFLKTGLGLACVMFLLAPVLAGDKKTEAPGEADEMAAMMAEIMKYAMPGEHHEHLQPLAGRWKLSSKFRMAADAPWSLSSGESVMDWILGGRFLQQRVTTPPSEEMPVAFEGFGLLGYDNLAKEHFNLWTDNFQTGIMLFTGSCDASGRVLTFAGEFKDPKKGGGKTKERWVYRIINNDKFIFEMWGLGTDGKEYVHGEITYTRIQ